MNNEFRALTASEIDFVAGAGAGPFILTGASIFGNIAGANAAANAWGNNTYTNVVISTTSTSHSSSSSASAISATAGSHR